MSQVRPFRFGAVVGLTAIVTTSADIWPPDLEVFNSTTRQRTLNALLCLGAADVASIAARTGVSRSMVLRHIDALEGLGVVVGSLPRSARPGRAVSYVIDRVRYADCLVVWDLWMMPSVDRSRREA